MSLAEKERHMRPKNKHKNLKKELIEAHRKLEDSKDMQEAVDKHESVMVN